MSRIGHGETIVSNMVQTASIEICKQQETRLIARVHDSDNCFGLEIPGGNMEFPKNNFQENLHHKEHPAPLSYLFADLAH